MGFEETLGIMAGIITPIITTISLYFKKKLSDEQGDIFIAGMKDVLGDVLLYKMVIPELEETYNQMEAILLNAIELWEKNERNSKELKADLLKFRALHCKALSIIAKNGNGIIIQG